MRRVGVLEFDMLPFGIFDDLTKGAPATEFADATEAFASVRQYLDETEIALIGRTDELVRRALVAPSPGMEAGALPRARGRNGARRWRRGGLFGGGA